MKRLMFALVVSLLSGGVFATEYFVDASRPDDSGDGKSEKTAKRTLNGALSLSGLADGDIVTVLPGVYDEGVMTCSDDNKTARRSRAIIRKNITFRSRDGRDVTFIMGAADTTSGSAYGMGPDAVTCIGVAKAGAGCAIRGFTFRGRRSNKGAETGGSCGGSASRLCRGCRRTVIWRRAAGSSTFRPSRSTAWLPNISPRARTASSGSVTGRPPHSR